MKFVKPTKKAANFMHIIFHTKGVKGINSLRDAVEGESLHCSGADSYHAWGKDEDAPRLKHSTQCFVNGWRAAGGGDLYVTWHSLHRYVCFMFWREDPADLLEKLIREEKPELLVKHVMEE